MLNYTTVVTDFANTLEIDQSNAQFQLMVPNAIDYAELRLYRDLDLLATVVRQNGTCTAGNRTFNLPSTNGTFVVVKFMNVITSGSGDTGARSPLVPAASEMMDFLWPSSTGSTVPQYFAMINDTTTIFAPWPDQAYSIEVGGTIRPNALSSTNVTTILTQYFPDLFLTAMMIWGTGYQQNFGAKADNPEMAGSWETTYKNLLTSAATEEARKRLTDHGWSKEVQPPQPIPRS